MSVTISSGVSLPGRRAFAVTQRIRRLVLLALCRLASPPRSSVPTPPEWYRYPPF